MSRSSVSASAGARRSVLGYGHVCGSLLLVFPLFLAYELGLLLTPASNGVDFTSRLIFDAVERDPQNYLLVHLLMAVAFLLLLHMLHRRGILELERIWPVVLESCIYALTLGCFIIFVMDSLLGLELLAVGGSAQLGNALVISLGAGVHEELVFRLGLMGIGGLLLTRLFARPGAAIFVAAVLSSLAFAMAHHLGAAGEPFEVALLAYRFIAGLAFAAIFYYRSLAHAVYSHFLYDLYVLGVAH
ncbi:MAG: CPBP family intramembrane metalloprotease [Myxococcales bacterium]|nr:CPBP family intramembrane metalloprotease [Myxococcales bacterium]